MSGSHELSYEDMKLLWEKRSFKVTEPGDSFARHEKTRILTYTDRRLLDSYHHLKYRNPDNSTLKPFIKEWIRDKGIRVYQCMRMYPPPLICPPDHYNTWRDFDIKVTSDSYAADLSASDLESMGAYIDHIRILFPSAFDYVTNFFAQMFQDPSRKIRIALIMKGLQGVGKNRLLDLIKLMMGHGKCLETSRPDVDIYGRFTDALCDKVLVIVNSDIGSDNSIISDMITSETYTWEARKRDSKMLSNFFRFVFTMNATANTDGASNRYTPPARDWDT